MSIIGVEHKSVRYMSSSSSSSDESMKYCQHYARWTTTTCPTAPWMDPWNTRSNFPVNVLSVTLRTTIDLFQTGWWEWILFTFSGAMRKIKLTDENLWLVTLLAFYQWPVFTFLVGLSPAFFPSFLLIYLPPFILLVPLSSPPHRSFTAPFFALLSTTPFAPLSQLLTSLCRSITEPLVSRVPVSSIGQVMNLSPLLELSDTDLFYHPVQWGQDRVGRKIGRCRSRLVWRDHHTGTLSARNAGWHGADCSMMGARSNS